MDDKKILIINNAEKGIDDFVIPLREIALESGAHVSVIEYEETLNTDVFNFDGVIMSGSPRGNDIVDHHLPYFQWIKTYEKPVLGICAGHHITGKLYGAEVIRDKEKEVGDLLVFIDRRDPVFESYSDKFLASQNHHDSITLPDDFILLAHSTKCRNAMMKHKDKPVYTTQFHPEVLNKKIMLNFIQMIR